MKATNTNYDFTNSLNRIDEILNAGDGNFEEKDSIHSRDELTFNNGFYVNCTALFIDICDSSDLPNVQRRPVLAKIYRSFISEMVALLNGDENCREVSINGDCVWGVFEISTRADIDDVFSLACRAASLVDILNYKLQKKGYQTYEVGIGLDYGCALMIKAGYKGSSINDVVWMGDVVNQACHLCAYGNQTSNDGRIMLAEVIYNNLNDHNKSLCYANKARNCYHADAINTKMDEWLKEQIAKDKR